MAGICLNMEMSQSLVHLTIRGRHFACLGVVIPLPEDIRIQKTNMALVYPGESV